MLHSDLLQGMYAALVGAVRGAVVGVDDGPSLLLGTGATGGGAVVGDGGGGDGHGGGGEGGGGEGGGDGGGGDGEHVVRA